MFDSDYFIPAENIKKFEDDVRNKSNNEMVSHTLTCSDNWTATKATQEDIERWWSAQGLACRKEGKL